MAADPRPLPPTEGRHRGGSLEGEELTGAWDGTPLEGYGLPDPPEDLPVGTLGPRRAGSRPHAFALRGLGWFAEEAAKDPAPEYVLAGIEAVATDLHALHYLYSYRRLFVAVQVRAQPSGERFTIGAAPDELAEIARLESLTLEAAAKGALGERGRIIAVNDMFGNSFWRFTGDPPAASPGGIAGAIRFVQQLAGV